MTIGHKVRLAGGLVLANAAAWGWAWLAFRGDAALLGTALLAWVFGLRHAVDADHIAAIDNVVRKLMQAGRPAARVGLWFSLGHSTVVILACAALTAAASAAGGRLERAADIGGVAGTLVSATFLLAIAAANMAILASVWRRYRQMRRGGSHDHEALAPLPAGRGVLTRLFRPVMNAITRDWHMYPLGFLFGLGFDTATEIGLLGLSATQAARGMSPWQAMVFPALFTAGMAAVDTADSVLMAGAYGWAFVDPLHKLRYNMTITAASVLVALLIGGIEAAGLAASHLALTGPVWDLVQRLNASSGTLGAAIGAIFVLCWAASFVLARWLPPRPSRQ